MRFALGLFILTPATMALWWFLIVDGLLAVLLPLTDRTARSVFAGTVTAVESFGAGWDVHTSLGIAGQPSSALVFALAPHRYTLGLPLYWSLALSTPGPRWLAHWVLGTVALVPIMVLMLTMSVHAHLGQYRHAGPAAPPGLRLDAEPYSPLVYHITMLEGDVAGLVLPVLAPVMLWAGLNPHILRPGRAWATDPPASGRGRRRRR